MEDIRGVRLRKFKLRKIILGVRMHFRHSNPIILYALFIFSWLWSLKFNRVSKSIPRSLIESTFCIVCLLSLFLIQYDVSTLWFKKTAPTLADYNYDPVLSILIIFSKLSHMLPLYLVKHSALFCTNYTAYRKKCANFGSPYNFNKR